MRILFLSTLLPGLRRTGSEVATQGFVDALRDGGHEVVLLGYRRVGTDPPMAPGDVAVADRHIETLGAGLRPAIWMLRAVATRRPYSVAKYVGRAYRRAMDDALARLDPELIVLDHAQMGWLVPAGGLGRPDRLPRPQRRARPPRRAVGARRPARVGAPARGAPDPAGRAGDPGAARARCGR